MRHDFVRERLPEGLSTVEWLEQMDAAGWTLLAFAPAGTEAVFTRPRLAPLTGTLREEIELRHCRDINTAMGDCPYYAPKENPDA